MEKGKYKIVVLSNLSSKTDKLLQTTARLADIINAEIEIFNVKKPTDVVGIDNQLSAMRAINSEHSKIDKKFRKLTTPILKEYGVNVRYSFAFGNLKNEISKYIEESKPDIIVIGKRKYSSLSFIGDNIAEFLLDSFKEPILILSEKGTLDFDKKISIGVLNSLEQSFNINFSEALIGQVKKPIRSFKFIDKRDVSKRITASQNEETIEYIFEYNDGAIQNLSKYLSKNGVDLFCIHRGSESHTDEANLKISDVKNIINKTKVSILVSSE